MEASRCDGRHRSIVYLVICSSKRIVTVWPTSFAKLATRPAFSPAWIAQKLLPRVRSPLRPGCLA